MNVGIIPARYASTRLPGKPLAEIGGKPMIQHVYERAKKSALLDKVIIATDDERIRKVTKSFDAETVMTPKDCQSGSDRLSFIVKTMPDADVVVNIQGDEPFIHPALIDAAIEPLLFYPEIHVSTLIKEITTEEELLSPSVVKCVFDYNNFALYFSRSPIPFVRDLGFPLKAIPEATFFKHIGLYVYRRNSLLKFSELQPTFLEQTEHLEQLRMLENGMKIKVVETDIESYSIDTPEDLMRAREYFEEMQSRGLL